MSFNVLGVLILLVLVWISYPFLDRLPRFKKFMSKWYFWTIFASVFFVYNLTLYIDYVWIHGLFGSYGPGSVNPNNDYSNDWSTIFSDVAFLAMCGFATMFLPLMIIFNPTKKLASYIAPVTLCAGPLMLIADMIGGHTLYDLTGIGGHYTFLGIIWNHMGTVLRHLLLSIISYMILFNTPKYNLRGEKWYQNDVCGIATTWVSYNAYTLIVTGILYATPGTKSRAGYGVNGLFPRDWEPNTGTYGFCGQKVHDLYPLGPIVLWLLIAGAITCLWLIFNKVKTYKSFTYTPPDYWYIKNLGGPKHKWWQW